MNEQVLFKKKLNSFLSTLPKTRFGEIMQKKEYVEFGHPSGSHIGEKYFVFTDFEQKVKMYIGFFSNFTDSDLLTKITAFNDPVPNRLGASIQFNGNKCIAFNAEKRIIFQHQGLVAVRSQISRDNLSKLLNEIMPSSFFTLFPAINNLNPVHLGSLDNLSSLLENIFLYSFAIEQVKKAVRKERTLPLVIKAKMENEKQTRIGQGFSSDTERNKIVEIFAMNLAMKHFESNGYQVTDVSANSSYDLKCQKNNEIKYVEVKGTTQSNDSILLTKNEVKFGMENSKSYVLFLVHNIIFNENNEIIDSQSQIINEFDLRNYKLEALTYSCLLK